MAAWALGGDPECVGRYESEQWHRSPKPRRNPGVFRNLEVIGSPAADQRLGESVQISKTPVADGRFALPSGSAILLSTTIGLFQWPEPHCKSAI